MSWRYAAPRSSWRRVAQYANMPLSPSDMPAMMMLVVLVMMMVMAGEVWWCCCLWR